MTEIERIEHFLEKCLAKVAENQALAERATLRDVSRIHWDNAAMWAEHADQLRGQLNAARQRAKE